MFLVNQTIDKYMFYSMLKQSEKKYITSVIGCTDIFLYCILSKLQYSETETLFSSCISLQTEMDGDSIGLKHSLLQDVDVRVKKKK